MSHIKGAKVEDESPKVGITLDSTSVTTLIKLYKAFSSLLARFNAANVFSCNHMRPCRELRQLSQVVAEE